MIKEILLAGFLIISALGFGQQDFIQIDKNSKSVPNSLINYKEIAEYLTKDLKTDTEKARAIYIWIAHNIEYDMSQMTTEKRYNSDQGIIDEVLHNRKGVCQHYSELFLAMSKSVGLNCYLISGYTRDGFGKIANLNHVWNGIKIDSDYYLIDVTWAAGYVENGKYIQKFRDNYFLKSPEEFIKDHMPFDPIWQFITNPITNDDFISQDFSKLGTTGSFAFEDSILQYKQHNELNQLENSNRRIIANGIKNNLIQKEVNENILQITYKKYNIAIDTLNYGINNYNLYITNKNNKFRNPKLEDSRIKELITNADKGISAANNILNELFTSDKELKGFIEGAQNQIPELITNLEKEKDFVDRYLKKWKPLRIFMFYSYG